MEKNQAVKLLTLVRGVWPRQPADDPTIAVWAEVLRDVEYELGRVALREFIDVAHHEAPTVAEIRKLALSIARSLGERERTARKALMEPAPDADEVARNKATIHEIIERLAEKCDLGEALAVEQARRTVAAHAEIAASGGIDAETQKAQELLLSRRRAAARGE